MRSVTFVRISPITVGSMENQQQLISRPSGSSTQASFEDPQRCIDTAVLDCIRICHPNKNGFEAPLSCWDSLGAAKIPDSPWPTRNVSQRHCASSLSALQQEVPVQATFHRCQCDYDVGPNAFSTTLLSPRTAKCGKT